MSDIWIIEGKPKSELKPCPFCGGEAALFNSGRFWWICKVCGVCSIEYDSKEQAIEAWDKRVE